MLRLILMAFAVLAMSPLVSADPPRGWRGDGSGKFASTHPPVKWSATENVLWRASMPAKSNAQPLIVGRRVFTLAEPNTLICVDNRSGKTLWQRTNRYRDLVGETQWKEITEQLKQAAMREKRLAEFRSNIQAYQQESRTTESKTKRDNLRANIKIAELQIADLNRQLLKFPLAKQWKTFPTHDGKNGYTTATPVTDGKHVWAVFGNAVVCCYDLDGKRIWRKRMRDKPHEMFGHSASPLLIGDKLIVNIQDTVAMDKASGKDLWRTGWGQCWGSAIHVKAADGTDLVAIANGRFLRLSDGKVVGRGINLSDSSPVFHKGIVYYIQNGGGAVKLGKVTGDKLELTRLWSTNPPGSRYFSSPVLHDGLLYTMSSEHVFSAIDAKTGKVVYRRRLNVGSGTGYPSVAFAGGLLYASSDNGTTVVIQPGRAFKEISRSQIDGFISTPVFAGDRMYLRTFRFLYCIGAGE